MRFSKAYCNLGKITLHILHFKRCLVTIYIKLYYLITSIILYNRCLKYKRYKYILKICV